MALSYPHQIQFVDAGLALPASLTADQIEDPSTLTDSETVMGQFEIEYDKFRRPFPNDPLDDSRQLVKMLGWTIQPAIVLPGIVSTFQAELTASADYSNRVKIVTPRKSYDRMINYFRGLRDFAVNYLGVILLKVPSINEVFFVDPIDDENLNVLYETIGVLPENGYIRNKYPVISDIQANDAPMAIRKGIAIPTPLSLSDRLLDVDNATFLFESVTQEL